MQSAPIGNPKGSDLAHIPSEEFEDNATWPRRVGFAFCLLLGGSAAPPKVLFERMESDSTLMMLVRRSVLSDRSHRISEALVGEASLERSLRQGLAPSEREGEKA